MDPGPTQNEQTWQAPSGAQRCATSRGPAPRRLEAAGVLWVPSQLVTSAAAAPQTVTSRALRRSDGGALSNPAPAPCRGLPTRLADGLGLESTPVRRAEPAPLERDYPAAPMVPPLRRPVA